MVKLITLQKKYAKFHDFLSILIVFMFTNKPPYKQLLMLISQRDAQYNGQTDRQGSFKQLF